MISAMNSAFEQQPLTLENPGRTCSPSVDQNLRSGLEEHFNLGYVFHLRFNAKPEVGVLHDIARRVLVLGGIGLGGSDVLSLQERLILVRPRPYWSSTRRTGGGFFRLSRSGARGVIPVRVLRFASVAG